MKRGEQFTSDPECLATWAPGLWGSQHQSLCSAEDAPSCCDQTQRLLLVLCIMNAPWKSGLLRTESVPPPLDRELSLAPLPLAIPIMHLFSFSLKRQRAFSHPNLKVHHVAGFGQWVVMIPHSRGLKCAVHNKICSWVTAAPPPRPQN